MFHSTIRNPARRMASKVRFSSSYREKTFKENWLMDSGAYPIMGVIVVACTLPIVAGMRQWCEPDNRFFSANRKQIFRGELADQYTHEKK